MAEDLEEEEWHSLKYWQNRPLQQRLSLAHIPRRFAELNLESYVTNDRYGTPEALALVRNLDVQRGDWALLFGKPGRGKTHLAAAALRMYVYGGGIGCFLNVRFFATLLADHRRNWGLLSDPYPTQHLLKYLQQQWPLVVLDDLGVEDADRQTVNGIETLLAQRYERQLAVIITTQLGPDALLSRYGADTISRMQEVGHAVVMVGDDYREKSGLKL